MVNITDLPFEVIKNVGQIGLWLQAIGIVVVLVIILNTIAFFLNRKRLKELYKIKDDIVRIENKIDTIISQTSGNQKK